MNIRYEIFRNHSKSSVIPVWARYNGSQNVLGVPFSIWWEDGNNNIVTTRHRQLQLS